MNAPKVTKLQGTFSGGKYPIVPCTIRILDFSLPKGNYVIGGKLYRETFDP